MRLLLVIFLLLAVIVACTAPSKLRTQTPDELPTARVIVLTPNVVFANDVEEAEYNYGFYCAHCHGYNGEGQPPDITERTLNLGYNPVPPHDSTGHTWMHTDEQLFNVIVDGIENPLDLYPMSGYRDYFTDEEIYNIITYLKGWWTDDQRAYQKEVNRFSAEARGAAGIDVTPTP